MYSSLYSNNGKTWGEMTEEERTICLVVIGVMVLVLIGYGIYYYFKNRKKKNK